MGILNLDGAPVDRDLVAKMTDALAFRGPDAQRTWSDEHVAFGHTLLRTTDEAAYERQPLSLDGSVTIVADGRVDDRRRLIDALSARGFGPEHAETTPDVELLLRAYRVGYMCRPPAGRFRLCRVGRPAPAVILRT